MIFTIFADLNKVEPGMVILNSIFSFLFYICGIIYFCIGCIGKHQSWMKEKLALGLIFCIMFQHVMLMVYYHAQTLLIYTQMKHKIEYETTETLYLTKYNFDKTRIKKDELIIGGKYFDIKHMSQKNDTVIVTGIWDHKETEVMRQLELNLNLGLAKKILKLFPSWMTPTILSEHSIMPIIYTAFDEKSIIPAYFNSYSISTFKKLIKPPILAMAK
jgi:hypothetical protein